MSDLEKWAHQIALRALTGEAFKWARSVACEDREKMTKIIYARAEACYDAGMAAAKAHRDPEGAMEAARTAINAEVAPR